MRTEYQFILSSGGTSMVSEPVYGSGVALDLSREAGERYYRRRWTGALNFIDTDFDFIMAQPFDAEIALSVNISRDGGATWAPYWTGAFWRTDCVVNEFERRITVTPEVRDGYDDILAGIDNEYNLIDLAPEIVPVHYDKRAMIQFYTKGSSVVGCVLGGLYWEQEAEPTQSPESFFFERAAVYRTVTVTGASMPNVAGDYSGQVTGTEYELKDTNRPYYISYQGGVFFICDAAGNRLFRGTLVSATQINFTSYGAGATGVLRGTIGDRELFARLVLDLETVRIGSVTYATQPIPANDIVADNRNYRRVIPYAPTGRSIVYIKSFSSEPTKWGLYQPGQYYAAPVAIGYDFLPIARSDWGELSVWFAYNLTTMALWGEEACRAEATLRDAYPLSSVIAALLKEIAPGVSHEGTMEYSQFLYGPLVPPGFQEENGTLFITPKSNLINSGYDQPAQKAPVTLRQIFDMLRDVFRCYWFVEDGKLKIEHVYWFMGGGSYAPGGNVGVDLTTQGVPRTGKPWAYGQTEYRFDRPSMPQRYQFGWGDPQTEPFDGWAMEMQGGYVDKGSVRQVNVNNFSTDIDYILLNPGDISPDGFVLLTARRIGGGYKVRYWEAARRYTDYDLQNGQLSFWFAELNYYVWDLPAPYFLVDGIRYGAAACEKLKRQEGVTFPVPEDPDPMALILTDIGGGEIEKILINLTSRSANATLRYDTE